MAPPRRADPISRRVRRRTQPTPRRGRSPTAPRRLLLVPGFFGFANLGEVKYFGHVQTHLAARLDAAGVPAEIAIVRHHPTASFAARATRVLEVVHEGRRNGADPSVHLIGHSSGGIDARLLASPAFAARLDPRDREAVASIRSVVTVTSPHRGTPAASAFSSVRGAQMLRLLSLGTIYVLRFGRLPIAFLLRLRLLVARLDQGRAPSSLLDHLFDDLLGDFSRPRRRDLIRFFADVGNDQDLLGQLSPETMRLFDDLLVDAPGVRHGCVVARAPQPGIQSTLAAGFDPGAQGAHAVFVALHQLAAGEPDEPTPRRRDPARRSQRPRPRWRVEVTPQTRAVLRHGLGSLPTTEDSDGVVPTLSQLHGSLIHAAQADHLDVLGHYHAPEGEPPHYDWLPSGAGFDRTRFEQLWDDVLAFVLASPEEPT